MIQSFQRASHRFVSFRSWGTVAGLATLFVATTASADVACGDQICPKGYECQSYEAGAACPAIATADGKAIDCVATPTTYYSCAPAACTADSDCGDGMVCYTSTSSLCSGATAPACPPDAVDCKGDIALPEPSCTTVTKQECTPRYLIPCAVDSDCGGGFTCEEQQSCWCSGSGGAATPGTSVTAPTSGSGAGTGGSTGAGASGVAATDVAMPTDTTTQCGCEPTGNFACKLQDIACADDGDCPTGLACLDYAVSSSCARSSDGTSTCSPVETSKRCQSMYQRLGGAGSVDLGSKGDSTSTPTVSTNTGTDGSTPPGNQAAEENVAPLDNRNVTGGGCAMAPTRGTSGVLGILLAVLFATRLRKARLQKQ